MEGNAFPSDEVPLYINHLITYSLQKHAVEAQARLHGLDPAKAIVRLKPREGEHTLRTEDIVSYTAGFVIMQIL